MPLFVKAIDFITLGSDRPIRRLVAYYTVLAAIVVTLIYFFPVTDRLLMGRGLDPPMDAPRLLQDGLTTSTTPDSILQSGSLLALVVTTAVILIGTLAMMLPVSWVYMSTHNYKGHDQSLAQTLIILPLVVAGIVLIVRNNLALAFSLAGVVAAVRFRNNLRDTRDVVFIFLAISVGFAAGVQTLAVGAVLSIFFNFVILLTWRFDFGRNVLTPTAASEWARPLDSLASDNGNGDRHGRVPDRDLILALSPDKVDRLTKRFERVRNTLGPRKKKPRYNAVLSVTSGKVSEAQVLIQRVLDEQTKRWTLDEVITNTGKPSELYYLVRLPKALTRDAFITAIREVAGDRIEAVELEMSDSFENRVKESA